MARLPAPGSDEGTWGDILNDFLKVILNPDGTLKADVVSDANITAVNMAKVSGLANALAAKYELPAGGIPESSLASGVASKLNRTFGNVLVWNGSDYIPTSLKADTSQPREFRGPTDPATVTGVVVTNYDSWLQS